MTTIEDIRARREAATPGPYKAVKYHGAVAIWIGEARPDAGFPLDTPLCTFHNRTPGSGAGDPQMVADATFLAAVHEDIAALLGEIERQRYALAKCLAAMQEDAMDSDGYSEREIEACELAAPLVGIEWSWRYGAYDEEIYSMKPDPVEVAASLQP